MTLLERAIITLVILGAAFLAFEKLKAAYPPDAVHDALEAAVCRLSS